VRALWSASIWARDAIPPEEWKDRHDKRLWLPLWDLIMIGAGIWATAFGSPLLHRLFPEDAIDLAGMSLAVSATVCLMGVAFPALWAVEFLGKLTVMFLLGAYAACVLFFRTDPGDPSSGFVAFILCAAIIPACSRLSKLGEEWKERRTLRQAEKEAAAARAEVADG
jgi:hypothetical protein